MEKYLDRPRHIELQIMADKHGDVVHFGERDCSLQRRHQKVLEEAGSPALITPAQRDALGETATAALRKLGYRNAGTLEFLYQDGQFAFIEMNTRLQVEHPVTEMVCGVDLVREQIRIAAGAPLGYGQARYDVHRPCDRMPHQRRGPGDFHADARPGAPPSTRPAAWACGSIRRFTPGYFVPPYYDSMVAKLIVHAPTRDEAISRLRRAWTNSPSWGSRPPSRCTSGSSRTRSSRRATTRSIGWSGSSPSKELLNKKTGEGEGSWATTRRRRQAGSVDWKRLTACG